MMDFTYEFIRREPVFQHPEFGRTRKDFEKLLWEGFYGIDVFGRCYSRMQAIVTVTTMYEDPNYCGIYSWPEDSWRISELSWHTLSHNKFLTSYLLHRDKKATRRTSIWIINNSSWKILFHQATPTRNGEDTSIRGVF